VFTICFVILPITVVVLSEEGTAYPSRAPVFTMFFYPSYHGSCLIRRKNCLPFESTCVHHLLFGGFRAAHLSLVFRVVLLGVFTLEFLVPCCNVRYDFRMHTMFGYSLPPVVCRRAHVLFTLILFVC
jgi:hypothetical protein